MNHDCTDRHLRGRLGGGGDHRRAGRAGPRGIDVGAWGRVVLLLFLTITSWAGRGTAAEPTAVELKRATVEGSIDERTARLVIQAALGGASTEEALVVTSVQQHVRAGAEGLDHDFTVDLEAVRGGLREVVLTLTGDGALTQVEAAGLESWSERRRPGSPRALVLLFARSDTPRARATVRIRAADRWETVPIDRAMLLVSAELPVLGAGVVRIDPQPGLGVEAVSVEGLSAVAEASGGAGTNAVVTNTPPGGLVFQFRGVRPALTLRVLPESVEARRPAWTQFELEGRLGEDSAEMAMRGVMRVRHPAGGRIELLAGDVALSEFPPQDGWWIESTGEVLTAVFTKPGDYPVRLQFRARVTATNGSHRVGFRVAPAAFAPVRWTGLGEGVTVESVGGSAPVRQGEKVVGHLPSSGRVELAWRPARSETDARLFYSAEVATQVAVSPGLLRQMNAIEVRVMQGELSGLDLLLRHEGDVARVQGTDVLSWSLEPAAGTTDRVLRVRLNQVRRDRVNLLVDVQRALPAFPTSVDMPQLEVRGAIRTSSQVRIVNDGAVRLEVSESTGWNQVSPEQFVQNEATRSWPPVRGGQVFAFRAAGPTRELRLQADHIQPELGVSEVLHYHLGVAESSIDADLEIDVREAPLRELVIRLPAGYAVARLQADGLADSVVGAVPEGEGTRVRLLFSAPVTGRVSIQARFERNEGVSGARSDLARVDVEGARSVRGHVGVTADPGLRLSLAAFSGLTEVVTSYFPRRISSLQLAMRVTEPEWALGISIERLAQTVQADVFHLFTVGEGVAYGSSLMNYSIAGAPLSQLRVQLSAEYFNVEFVGPNVRNWQKVDDGYEVQLNGPVSGSYGLLATYERPFRSTGETIAFTGARCADAGIEQGHVLVVSAHPFEVEPEARSEGLTPIESGEVPAEYRLFFDAPILSASRYLARPFDLRLRLRPLAQVPGVRQVVDRASLNTRLSEDGQVVTEARYFVKSGGPSRLPVRLAEGDGLWTVLVDGAEVVPVRDDTGLLVPLPARADPNVLTEVRVTTASNPRSAARVRIQAPVLGVPTTSAEWRVNASSGRQLEFRAGSIVPVSGRGDRSGFAELARLSGTSEGRGWRRQLAVALAALMLAGVLTGHASHWVTRRFSLRFWATGALALGAGLVMFVSLVDALLLARRLAPAPVSELSFVMPVQPAGALWWVELNNLKAGAGVLPGMGSWLLALVAGVIWVASWLHPGGVKRTALLVLAWTTLVWAALRAPSGASLGVGVLLLFGLVQILAPGMVRWWRAGARSSEPGGDAGPGVAPSMAGWMIGLGVLLSLTSPRARAAESGPPARADAVRQEIRVTQDRVVGTAAIRWQARVGAVLPLLGATGTLTLSTHDPGAARLLLTEGPSGLSTALLAQTNAVLEFEVRYESRVSTRGAERGFVIPVAPGLVNRAHLVVEGAEVEVRCKAAMASLVSGVEGGSRTSVDLVLRPVEDAWLGWLPKARDPRRERAEVYVDWTHLLVPGVGSLQGVHEARVRPARGEVAELTIDVPRGVTISRVEGAGVGTWRFDPDAGRLQIMYGDAQSKPFTVRIETEALVGALPIRREVGLPVLTGAAGEHGVLGIATGDDVQLDAVGAEGFSPMNLEDFPALTFGERGLAEAGLGLRRVFRRGSAGGQVEVRASAVEPEVRVESQQTLSLGDDRVVLAATLAVEVLRSGIFKLSFPLPDTMAIESASGGVLSHWTELKSGTARWVTLHLKGRTVGQQTFNLVLSGPGVRPTNGWVVPRVALREATKQRGQMGVVPEQGLRARVARREGATLLDPASVGLRQKGALAFRLLQDAWELALDLERVDAWIQVVSLQQATVSEAQVKVETQLQYEVENAGIKGLRVRLPARADSVSFQGEQVGSFASLPADPSASEREWEVRLERRWIGRSILKVSFVLPLAAEATEVTLSGVRALDASLQRGFVTVEAAGRLQVRPEPGPTLQVADAASVPRGILAGPAAAVSGHVFRVMDPDFSLPVRIDRHPAARLLPARVQSVTMDSVVADEGAVLTRTRVALDPGDKRLLGIRLPASATFWFAQVNHHGVASFQVTNEIRVPLEKNPKQGEPAVIEFFHLQPGNRQARTALDLGLEAPQFDLPLENITWNVHLNGRWKVRRWRGGLELTEHGSSAGSEGTGLAQYLEREGARRATETREAGEFLSLANSLLGQGSPQEARRAFQAAYGLSQHDQAFNEDARVQLNNLRRQQALVGLNVRRSRTRGESEAATPAAAALDYTQDQAKRWLERATPEEAAIQDRLAERLIQQQDAAQGRPASIRATLPEIGQRLRFTRPLEVNVWAPLRMRIEARAPAEMSSFQRLLVLGGVFGVLGLVRIVTRGRAPAR